MPDRPQLFAKFANAIVGPGADVIHPSITSALDYGAANMVFSVAQIIAFVTDAITLEAGDVIFTGTPSGVGHGMDPPQYLTIGDAVRVEIDGIGAIEHRIVGP